MDRDQTSTNRMSLLHRISLLSKIEVSDELTYVGAFLTLRCHYYCSYCINYQNKLVVRKEILPSQWADGLNRLQIKQSQMVPITFQGGEPSDYPGLTKIIQNLKDEFYVDILTNFSFDAMEFMDEIPPERLQRDVPYASIRATFHPGKVEENEFLGKVFNLLKKGYSVEAFGVDHPGLFFDGILKKCKKLGLSFRKKEFFGGGHERHLFGVYKYPSAMEGKKKEVECKTTELLIGPNGDIHKCRRDLYCNEDPLGNILDEDLEIEFKYRRCKNFGECSYYDVRIKSDRFGKEEVCPVEIRGYNLKK